MGIINIEKYGSFPRTSKTFRAQTSGHVVAVEDAIAWLQEELVKAEAQDTDLRKQGHAPDDNFAEYDKRHPLEDSEGSK